MLSYYGITELVGDSGSGKTAIAIEESKQFKTLYLTSTNFPIERFDFTQNQYDNVFIEVIQSISDLLFVLNSKFKPTVFIFELIVIDSLYQIVFIEKRSTREVTNLIYILKRMLKMYKNLRILVLNTCCLKTIRSNRVSFISKLGLNWEYHVNTKYKCQKQGENYKIEMVKSPMNQELIVNFKIKRNGIEVV
jgi:hypothetical protein